MVASVLATTVGLTVRAWLPRPEPAVFATIVRAPLTTTIHEPGRARLRTRHLVAAPVGGELTRIALEVGETTSESA
jgi:HlyD family secretion protein